MSSRKNKNYRIDLGDRIKWARIQKVKSDAFMTKKLRFKGTANYEEMEKGNSLTLENIIRICNVLKINYLWLITGDDKYQWDNYIDLPFI